MRIEVGAAIVLAGVVIAWIAVGGRSDEPRPAPLTATPSAEAAVSAASGAGGGEGSGDSVAPTPPADGPSGSDVSAASASLPASSPGSELPAAWSMADSRVAGDDRSPPIERSVPEAATPAWQLDNHPAYSRREQDRHQAVQRAFVDAADRELPRLDQQIEQGRAMGVSPEQLAKGEEKRRRIAEMRARMQADLAASAVSP
ncbi:hypothetical protein ACQ86G_20275 [Roseateles chitinivorans]|uniref:hypothetical protein n=1 Tax=Roseateles chitinivorans TaxID=2917965 RepID=UPI003D66DB50